MDVLGLQDDLIGGGVFQPNPIPGHGAAYHHVNHIVQGNLRQIPGAYSLAVPENGDPVADDLQLLKPMGDINNGDPVGGQILDGAEQHLDFLFAEGSRRLVHNQNAGILRKSLGNFHHLLLGNAQGGNLRIRADVGFQEIQTFLGILPHFCFVDVSAFQQRLPPQIDVLRHCQVGNQIEFLIDNRDSQILRILGVADGDLLSVDEDVSGINGIEPGKNLHQCGLAGTVFAQQNVNLSLQKVEGHIAQSLYTGERFVDLFRPQYFFSQNAHLLSEYHVGAWGSDFAVETGSVTDLPLISDPDFGVTGLRYAVVRCFLP